MRETFSCLYAIMRKYYVILMNLLKVYKSIFKCKFVKQNFLPPNTYDRWRRSNFRGQKNQSIALNNNLARARLFFKR